MNNSFGTIFRATTFGESHGGGCGVVIDGCPSRLALSEADIQPQLRRRRPGQSDIATPRQEDDSVQILSGVERGLTLGTPIALSVPNWDQNPSDYTAMRNIPRPSHADYTYQQKYGLRSASGGGRASARETIGRVAAGAVAEKLLTEQFGVKIVAWVSAVEKITFAGPTLGVTRSEVDTNKVRCPDAETAHRMETAIENAKADGDSVGGVITCVCEGIPPGWGEPVFDKLEALLGRAMLSIPACKGFEMGSGFDGTQMRGSAHNDLFVQNDSGLGTRTNNSGGVQGGISNGEALVMRAGFKPTSTIGKTQKTANFAGKEVALAAKGRHDPCVLPRAVPVVEGMAALVLADLALRQRVSLP